jgi:hypothetical protein
MIGTVFSVSQFTYSQTRSPILQSPAIILSFMLRTISLFTTLLVFAGHGVPQALKAVLKAPETPAPASAKLTMDRLAAAARAYLRDSAEFPLNMNLSMVAISTSGRTVKRDQATGTYDFHGYNPRSENANSSMRVSTKGLFHSTKWVMPVAWNSSTATFLLTSILFRELQGRYSLQVTAPANSGETMVARIPQLPGCSVFKWSSKDTSPEELCGASQFEVQKDNLSLRRFSFDAGGLPIATTVKPFGKCELRSYHAEVEFQKVMLPDDPKPFLVPKHVEIVIETDKGKLDMISDYTPRK